MALSLGIRLYGKFYIEDTPYQVTKIHGTEAFRISGNNKDYEIKDGTQVEIYPNVMVSVGYNGDMELARVAFTAPREIPILRGKIYWAAQQDTEVIVDEESRS